MYLWVKTFHLLFVIAWMASVFYLPRILVNLTETRAQPEVQTRLLLMAGRLYRFGHAMFGLAIVLGIWLVMMVPGLVAGWLHAKLALVAVLLAHFILAGRWLKSAGKGRALPSSRVLRWFNEVPVVVLIAVIWLVLAKPF